MCKILAISIEGRHAAAENTSDLYRVSAIHCSLMSHLRHASYGTSETGGGPSIYTFSLSFFLLRLPPLLPWCAVSVTPSATAVGSGTASALWCGLDVFLSGPVATPMATHMSQSNCLRLA